MTTLLGEGHRLAVIDRVRAKGGTLMGNGPSGTRALLDRKVQRMVEIQHNDHWCYGGNLDTPLGYAGCEPEFGNWIRALRLACFLVGTRYDYPYDISRYLFPFTPIELHSGYLLGPSGSSPSTRATTVGPAIAGSCRCITSTKTAS